MQFKGGAFPNKYFATQMVFVQTDTLLADADDVYTSALLAGAIKPLNVPSKFENHFAIRTVSFQVQLEAGGYFSAQKFSHLQPPQAGRVGTNWQFLNPILQIQLQNICWASPKPDVQHKNALVSHLNDR